jgi:hypothetical protein
LHSKNEFSSTMCTPRGENERRGWERGERGEGMEEREAGWGNRMRGAEDGGEEREEKALGRE